MTVQDLRPNSQDTSAFYLGNIYELLADPNVTRSSVPSPFAKPPPFSPPTYAIWVNSLWLLSFVLSLICALLATSMQQWARRYIRVTRPARCSPEKRARMRAFFSNGVDKRGNHLVNGGLPILLHLSVLLFFGGLSIFLFNTNRAVYSSVFWLIAVFSTMYVFLTLSPIALLDSPYFTPLSDTLFRFIHLELAVPFALFSVIWVRGEKGRRLLRLAYRHFRWASAGMEKAAEYIVSDRSWEVDIPILRWSIALGDNEVLEEVSDIYGFFDPNTNLSINWFWNALNIFSINNRILFDDIRNGWNRIFGRSSFSSLAFQYRLDIGMNAMRMIRSSRDSSASSNFVWNWDKIPQIAQMAPDQLLTYYAELTAYYAQCIIAKILASVPEHDDRWIQLATDAFDPSSLPRPYLQHDIDRGGNDNISLSISIHLIRRSIRLRFYDWDALKAFSKLSDINNALPELQHDFCMLWNEVVQEARSRKHNLPPVMILRWFLDHFIALHGHAGLTLPTDPFDPFYRRPSSYPLCSTPSHLTHSTAYVPVPYSRMLSLPPRPGDSPDGSPHQPTPGGNTVQRQAEEANIITGLPSPSDPMTTNEIRETAETLSTTIPTTYSINSGPRVTFTSPLGVGVHDNSRDRNLTIPMEVFRQSLEPVPSPTDTDTATNFLNLRVTRVAETDGLAVGHDVGGHSCCKSCFL